MSDPVLIALIGGIGAILASYFQFVIGKRANKDAEKKAAHQTMTRPETPSEQRSAEALEDIAKTMCRMQEHVKDLHYFLLQNHPKQ